MYLCMLCPFVCGIQCMANNTYATKFGFNRVSDIVVNSMNKIVYKYLTKKNKRIIIVFLARRSFQNEKNQNMKNKWMLQFLIHTNGLNLKSSNCLYRYFLTLGNMRYIHTVIERRFSFEEQNLWMNFNLQHSKQTKMYNALQLDIIPFSIRFVLSTATCDLFLCAELELVGI